MIGYTHAAIGAAEGFAYFLITKGNPDPYVISGIIIGNLLPDIDHANSLISKKFIFNLSFLGHRKIVHSLIGILALSVLPFLLAKSFGIGIFVGCLSHLFADSFTVSGIAFLYPFIKTKVRGPVRTGTIGDTLFMFGAIAIVVVMAALYLNNKSFFLAH